MAEGRKGTGGDLLLPEMALNIIRGRPRIGTNPFVLPGQDDRAFNGFAYSKQQLDAAARDAAMGLAPLTPNSSAAS